ncbi:DUF6221 family protein [Streptomyces sp. NPDC059340]|uniref:DUF6221 family protein n=1 Tax=Streptomyces sp. NPDC059340 TaxID=3346806 RepID=UPI003679BBF4
MDELVRWLGEQLDEDERIARDADPGPWKSDSLGRHDQAAIKLGSPTSTSLIQFDGSRAAANGQHVARHDPARVLREIEAKRDLLRLAERAHDYHETFTSGFASALEGTLRLFALAYADRPGYREEWAP